MHEPTAHAGTGRTCKLYTETPLWKRRYSQRMDRRDGAGGTAQQMLDILRNHGQNISTNLSYCNVFTRTPLRLSGCSTAAFFLSCSVHAEWMFQKNAVTFLQFSTAFFIRPNCRHFVGVARLWRCPREHLQWHLSSLTSLTRFTHPNHNWICCLSISFIEIFSKMSCRLQNMFQYWNTRTYNNAVVSCPYLVLGFRCSFVFHSTLNRN